MINWIHINISLVADYIGMDKYGEIWAVILAGIGYFIVSYMNTLKTRQSHLYSLISNGFSRDRVVTTSELIELKLLFNKIPSLFSMTKPLLDVLDSFNNIINTRGEIITSSTHREICDSYDNILLILSTQSYLPFMNKYKYMHDLRLIKPYKPIGVINLETTQEQLILNQNKYIIKLISKISEEKNRNENENVTGVT